MPSQIQIVECPRDAMQGIHAFIPTESKIGYLNALLKMGFHTLDFGSFVSPKAIPQLADTREVLENLELEGTETRLLAIVANLRGAEDATSFDAVRYIGYPFSVSETFQLRNTNKSVTESLELVRELQELATSRQKELVVYLSMAFGNPYGDEWSPQIVGDWACRMADLGIRTLALADTIGSSEPGVIRELFTSLLPKLPGVTLGAHFHSVPHARREKISAAWEAGCRRFDVALKGFGGCPFAKEELTGNLSTESLISFLDERQIPSGLNMEHYEEAARKADEVFARS